MLEECRDKTTPLITSRLQQFFINVPRKLNGAWFKNIQYYNLSFSKDKLKEEKRTEMEAAKCIFLGIKHLKVFPHSHLPTVLSQILNATRTICFLCSLYMAFLLL